MVNLTFSEETYNKFIEDKKNINITNSRLRPDDVPLIDVLLEEQEKFIQTPEGKQFMNFIASNLQMAKINKQV
jgi:hypothetical protein